jgi:hypothetical protein
VLSGIPPAQPPADTRLEPLQPLLRIVPAYVGVIIGGCPTVGLQAARWRRLQRATAQLARRSVQKLPFGAWRARASRSHSLHYTALKAERRCPAPPPSARQQASVAVGGKRCRRSAKRELQAPAPAQAPSPARVAASPCRQSTPVTPPPPHSQLPSHSIPSQPTCRATFLGRSA